LIEVWCTKSCFTEVIYECFEWFVWLLSDAQEGYGGSLMWTVVGKVGGEHVGEDVETVD